MFELADPHAEGALARTARDFRRMHERANVYWMSLLRGRSLPSLADIDFAATGDLEQHTVIIDLTHGKRKPFIHYVGASLAAECKIDTTRSAPMEIERDSLLDQALAHFLFTLLSSHRSVSFEAEHVAAGGRPTLFRGIFLPLSSDGHDIDYVYGVINWRHLAGHDAPYWGHTPGGVWRIAG